jgi:sodium/bile acid cotransporter 7
LLALIIKPLFPVSQQEIWLAIFFLCALPSTVSSSVVMVAVARGNVPGAILNAGISSLAGIVITPLWMSLFLAQDAGFHTGDVLLKLCYQVVLPVIAGQLLHRWWGAWAIKNARWLRWSDQIVILIIVYNSFCDSFYHHAFSALPNLHFFVLLAAMSTLFGFVYGIVTWLARQLHFSREDRITAQFCASKKSLVHGTVMSSVLFAGHPQAGLFLLPVMMYHALQLLAAGYLAQRATADTTQEIQ